MRNGGELIVECPVNIVFRLIMSRASRWCGGRRPTLS